MNTATLCAGLLAGLSIAVPVGPMSLLCIQRTLCWGAAVGFCTGLGAATVNVAYGTAVLFGLGRAGPWMTDAGPYLSAASGVFLLWTAARTALRRRAGVVQAGTAAPSRLGAYGSAVGFNATNPMSLLLVLALLSPAAALYHGPQAAGLFLLGMFGAAAAWWLCLATAVGVLRAKISPAVLGWVNRGAAALLTLYGAAALARSFGL